MAKENEATSTTERALVITRIFNAPVEAVWKAWTDPKQLMKWWGPKDFASPACNIDLRVGGKYLFCMRSPDGKDFWSTGTYLEIVPLQKIVFTDSFSDGKGNIVPASTYGMSDMALEMQVTITFENLGGKTKFTLQHVGLPAGEIGDMTSAGWNQSFDKLGVIINS